MQQSKLPSLFKFMPEPSEDAAASSLDHEKQGESSISGGGHSGSMKPSRKGKEKAMDTESDQVSLRSPTRGRRRPPRLLDVVDSKECSGVSNCE